MGEIGNGVYGFISEQGMPWWSNSEQFADANGGSDGRFFSGGIPLDVMRRTLQQWDATVYPLSYAMGTEQIMVPGYNAVVRISDGKLYQTVTQRVYETVSYADVILPALADIVGESAGDAQYVGAVGLRDGGRAFVQASYGKREVPGTGIEVMPFLFGASSHDGSLRNMFGTGRTVIVCKNTSDMAISEAIGNGTFNAFKHTRCALARLDAVKAKLRLEQDVDAMDAELISMVQTAFPEPAWDKVLDEIAPVQGEELSKHKVSRNERVRDELNTLRDSDERCAPWRDNLFGAFQTLNTHDEWFTGTRGGTDPQERAWDALLSGDRSKADMEIMELLTRSLASVA